MKNQFVKITKIVTGYRVYGKMAIQVGSIFQFVSKDEKEIRFHEIGNPNYEIALPFSLHSEDGFEILAFLNDENLLRLIADLTQKVAESVMIEAKSQERSRVLDLMISRLPVYQYKH